jgi:hypothetical protein
VANSCAYKLRSLANYDSIELGIKCPVDRPDIVEISGPMAHYYMPKVGMGSKMKQVSLGGSIIRVNQVRDFTTSPKIVDICKNIGILTSLVSGVNSGLSLETTTKSVRLKCHTSTSFGLEPCLIIGCNGGFQWLGNPTHIAESLNVMFAFISSNCWTPAPNP